MAAAPTSTTAGLADPDLFLAVDDLDLSTRSLVDSVLAGSHRGAKLGPGSEFAQHRDYRLGDDLRLEVVVEGRLILELKCVDRLLPIHESQLITYLKLTRIHTGLLVNFNVRLLREGIKRMVV